MLLLLHGEGILFEALLKAAAGVALVALVLYAAWHSAAGGKRN